MIKNLKSFQLDLKKFGEVTVPQEHLALQKKIAVKLHQLVVYKNSDMPKHPVDWGWARANWNVFAGATCPETDPGPRKRTGKIVDATSQLMMIKPFGMIWVYNNVSYIEALEDGHSKQAPTGMVDGALNDIKTFMGSL